MDIFLQYIRTHWYDNSPLNNADLTCKLTTLLALTTALRLSMIEHLSAEFMAEDKGSTYFISKSYAKIGGKARLFHYYLFCFW